MVFVYRIFYMYIFKCGLQPMNHEIAQRPADQHTGNSTPSMQPWTTVSSWLRNSHQHGVAQKNSRTTNARSVRLPNAHGSDSGVA